MLQESDSLSSLETQPQLDLSLDENPTLNTDKDYTDNDEQPGTLSLLNLTDIDMLIVYISIMRNMVECFIKYPYHREYFTTNESDHFEYSCASNVR